MERPDWAPEGVDVDRPSAARIYDYLLGGSLNFAADREVAEQAIAAMPDIRIQALANRAFLHRAVAFVRAAGVRQFLDLGSGVPTGNVHEIPDTRVAYVDIDPVAVAHGRQLLADTDRATMVRADLRRPLDILAEPDVRAVLDLEQPMAVLLVAVLHAVPDVDEPFAAIAQLRDALAPGSYLVIAHGTQESRPDDAANLVEISKRTTTPLTLRSQAEIARFFDGFEMVEPGLVWAPSWRPDPTRAPEHPERSGNLAGVGRRLAQPTRELPGDGPEPATTDAGAAPVH